METLIKSISNYIQLEPHEKTYFLSLLQRRKLANKEIILRPGEICKNSIFVVNGCLRTYGHDGNGFEKIMSFASSGHWIADMYSLLSQQPGNLITQAAKPSEIYLLPKARQEQLYADVPKFERFFRLLIENLLLDYQQRLMDNLTIRAEERFLKFKKAHPDLAETLPKKDIAAYIGVTPQFFSRMIAGISKKPGI